MRDQSLDTNSDAMLHQMIQPLERRVFRFPMYGLRVWFFSLLALIALPIGAMLMLIGIEMQENLSGDWQEVTATLSSNDDIRIDYDFDNDSGEIIYELDQFVTVPNAGEIQLIASICDLTAWLTIPSERGDEFPLWVNLDKPAQQSCVPISRDAGAIYITVGGILMLLSAIRLLRTIGSAAANKPKK